MKPPALVAATTPPPQAEWTVRSFDSIEDLAACRPAWDDLAAHALEPNVFLESWMFLPALQHLGEGVDFRFVLVYRPNPTSPKAPPLLSGFFPLARRRRYKGLPARTLSLWTHPFGLLGTPLLRDEAPRRCLQLFFDWLREDDAGATLVELDKVPADGRFFHEVIGFLNDNRLTHEISDSWTRAFLTRRQDAAACQQDALSGDQRKSLRRKAKRLGEEGKVEYRLLGRGDNVNAWLEDFMNVEASGWKGREGTAIGTRPEHRRFFLEAAAEGFRRGRMELLGLFLGGKPIAFQLLFPAASGAYAFKTAYDESYSRFSPGILIQLEVMERLHGKPATRWIDSNSEADGYLNGVWPDRRVMQNLLISSGRGWGDFLVSTLPLLRWVKRRLTGWRDGAKRRV